MKSVFPITFVILIEMFNIILLVEAGIIVRSPQELRESFPNGEIKAGYSNFGFIPYGYNLVGKLHYNPDDTTAGCDVEKMRTILSDDKPSLDNSPIVMIDRGSCNFIHKTKNIQDVGGHVALIVNNDERDPQTIIMADDGKGEQVAIPALLISKNDGTILKDFYTKNRNKKSLLDRMSLEINFEIEHKNNTVAFDVFMTSESWEVYELIEQIQSHLVDLGKVYNL